MNDEKTDHALDVVAVKYACNLMMRHADLDDDWEDYPDLGMYDFIEVVDRVKKMSGEVGPTEDEYKAAYDHLKSHSTAGDSSMNESRPKWADGPEQWRQGTTRRPPPLAHLRCVAHEALNCEECKGTSPEPDVRHLMRDAVGRPIGEVFALHSTQEALDGLAEQVAGMLDNALHLEACWISEDETRCVCLIAALRAALPRCGHVENIGVKGLTRQCLSTVHPSAAYKHVFGTV